MHLRVLWASRLQMPSAPVGLLVAPSPQIRGSICRSERPLNPWMMTRDPAGAGWWAQAESGDRWLLTAAMLELWRRTRADWRTILPAERRAWGRVVGIGLVTALATTAAIVLLGRYWLGTDPVPWEREALLSMDRQKFISFNSALWIEAPGNGFIQWGLVTVSACVAAWLRKPLLAASFFLGFGSLYLNILLGWFLWPRERPTLIAEGMASPGMLSSYPSGHVAQAVFVYGLLASIWWRQTAHWGERALATGLVGLMVSVIGIGRLRLGAHWPSDLLAGFLIGGVWLAVVILALNRAAAVADTSRARTSAYPGRAGASGPPLRTPR